MAYQEQEAAAHLSIRDLLKEALAGTQVSYATYSLNQAIALLAIPMMLEMALESVFGLTDIFWVSKLGPNAIATIGLTESLLTIIYAISSGLSTAATAMVARRIGENSPDKAATEAVQAIAESVGGGLEL